MSSYPGGGTPHQFGRSRSVAPTIIPGTQAGPDLLTLPAHTQTRGLSVPPTYQYPTQQHLAQSIPSDGGISNFLAEAYGPSNYPILQAPSYPQSQLRYTPDIQRISPLQLQSNLYPTEQASSSSQAIQGEDMSFAYMQSAQTGQHYPGPMSSLSNYQYSDPPRGSMSDSFGPTFPPHTVSPIGAAEREIARQRQRIHRETRRPKKARARRERVPVASSSRLGGGAQDLGMSVDFQTPAPSYRPTYVIEPAHKDSSASRLRPPYPTGGRDEYAGGGVPGQYSSQQYPQYPVMGGIHPTQYPSTMNPISGDQSRIRGDISIPPSITPNIRPHSSSISPSAPDLSRMEGRAVGGRDKPEKPQCWEHGCNGREFSTFSNLLRHQREKSGTAAKSYCPQCGAEFTRTTARNGHIEQGKCKPQRPSDERP
ncbi:hypothetical protein MMC25_003374 [Agyrium rufum]|nr:hypothetical protein [Agyrium rufum]